MTYLTKVCVATRVGGWMDSGWVGRWMVGGALEMITSHTSLHSAVGCTQKMQNGRLDVYGYTYGRSAQRRGMQRRRHVPGNAACKRHCDATLCSMTRSGDQRRDHLFA